MANPDHLEKLKNKMILKSNEWDIWRAQYPDIIPDLRKADLKQTDLSWVSLHTADLSEANLAGANLSNADLRNTNLEWTNFTEANLSQTNLILADLRQTLLTDARLDGAIIGGTALTCLNLSSTIGIEKVIHEGPSSLGTDTIKLSEGKLPDGFLRGCGLSPWEIEVMRLYDPDLPPSDVDEILATKIYQKRVDGPLRIDGVFISYSHHDDTFADRLYKRMKAAEVSVWLDKHDMLAGNIERQVMRQIRIKDIVVLVLSESSIKSDWVETELEEAREKEKAQDRDVLCPIAIDDSWQEKQGVLWRKLKRDKHILDFSAWETEEDFRKQFDKLIRGMEINY